MKDHPPDPATAAEMSREAEQLARTNPRFDFSLDSLALLDDMLDTGEPSAATLTQMGAYYGAVIERAAPQGAWVKGGPSRPDRPHLRFGRWYLDPVDILTQVKDNRSRGASCREYANDAITHASAPTSQTSRSLGWRTVFVPDETSLWDRARRRLADRRK